MKQQSIKFLFALFIGMMGVNASAHNIEVKNADGVTIYYNYINNKTELAVTYQGSSYYSYKEYTGDLIIPESVTYNGTTYSVTSIGGSAFQACSDLNSISIPNSVISIEESAFYNCSGLTSLTIPNSVTSIGEKAFYNCSGLTSLTIPNSVTSIGESAFSWCRSLTSIFIGNSMVNIGGGAFYECSGLTSIQVSEGNSKYDSRNGCNAIIETESNILIVGCKETVIPNSVTSIGGSAFRYCTNLTSIDIPNSVTSIGEYAFQDCIGLTSVTIPNSVTSIGHYAFSGCTGLTSVNIPNSVTSIDGGAFRECSSLTSVNIGNSVTSIGSESFQDCIGLTSVTIPNSVTSIGNYAFQRCTGLTSMTIPNSVTTIGNYAFEYCLGLTSITIPESVTSIGDGAFYYCDNLLTVRSEITEPFNCKDVFSKNTLRNGVLYVPASTKELYIRFDGWREFLRIEEARGEMVEYVWLTMKDGRGITKLKVKQGTRQELEIRPETGWKILTATIDGTDISSLIKSGNVYTTPAIMNDATISIVYEKDNTSGTFSARQSKTDIKVVDDGVVIYNAEPQSRCIVYGANGLPVANTVINDSTHKITLTKGQVYLLALGDRTLKFAL